MNAIRFGKLLGATTAEAASEAAGTMASNIGKATAVPNPFRKVRLGICHLWFISARFWLIYS